MNVLNTGRDSRDENGKKRSSRVILSRLLDYATYAGSKVLREAKRAEQEGRLIDYCYGKRPQTVLRLAGNGCIAIVLSARSVTTLDNRIKKTLGQEREVELS